MSDLLDFVEEECAHAAHVVDILDAQAAILHDGASDPNYRLLRDIMHYCAHYLPAVLFPYEDCLLERLGQHQPELHQLAEALHRRHERHSVLAIALHNMLDGVLSGHMVPRGRLTKETDAYITLLREHIAPLERQLIEAAHKLASEDLAVAERQCAARLTAETRESLREEFTRLRSAIDNEHALSVE
ncbi:MAG: hypothetical protein WD928_02475 [Gammaproteobacteria bacterium]